MPHEIDGNLAVYAKTPAWHHLGTVMEDLNAITAADALAVLNPFGEQEQYRKVPAFALVNGEYVKSDDSCAIVRKHPETGQLQVISFQATDYGNLQPEEIFGFLDNVVGQVGGAHYANAFFLRKGRQMCVTIDMGAVELEGIEAKDTIKRFLFCVNSWDGSWAFRTKMVNFRPDCANMAAMALRGSSDKLVPGDWSTKHVGDVMSRVKAAQSVLGLAKANFDLFADSAEMMFQVPMRDDTFDRLLTGLFTVDEATQEVNTKAIATVKSIYELSMSQANLYGTFWGGFNAVTEYHDWNTDVRGGRVSGVTETRFLRQLDDPKGLKQTAWDRFYATAQDNKPRLVAVP